MERRKKFFKEQNIESVFNCLSIKILSSCRRRNGQTKAEGLKQFTQNLSFFLYFHCHFFVLRVGVMDQKTWLAYNDDWHLNLHSRSAVSSDSHRGVGWMVTEGDITTAERFGSLWGILLLWTARFVFLWCLIEKFEVFFKCLWTKS